MMSSRVLAVAVSAWTLSIACSPEPDSGVQGQGQGLTAGAAYEVKDINPGPGNNSLTFFNGHALGNLLVFNADDGVHGYEPWVSDGTAAGTRMLADLTTLPDGDTGKPDSVQVMEGETLEGRLYFRARGMAAGTGQDIGFELYVTDGTPVGTLLIGDLYSGMKSFNPLHFARYTDPGGQEMLLFSATTYSSGFDDTEPWRLSSLAGGAIDGGTLIARVADVDPGPGGSSPNSFTSLNGEAYFLTVNPTSTMYSTTGAGAVPRLTLPGYLYFLEAVGGRLYFREGDRSYQSERLWSFEPDSGVSEELADAGQNGVFTPYPVPLASGSVLFHYNDVVHGAELWATDGTRAGTRLVKDINPGPAGSEPQVVGVLGGVGYAVAKEDAGMSLWRSDGTPAGTTLVKPLDGTYLFSQLVLTPEDVLLLSTGGSFWLSDGTPAGTRKLSGVPGAYGMARVDPRVFFSGAGLDGIELWAIDIVDLTDRTPPALTCPANVTLESAGVAAVVILPEASASDTVSPVTVSYSPASGTAFRNGTTTVTVTAADRVGNQSTCTFDVTVVRADAGGGGGQGACGCSSAGGTAGAVLLALLAAASRWRRRRRRAIASS